MNKIKILSLASVAIFGLIIGFIIVWLTQGINESIDDLSGGGPTEKELAQAQESLLERAAFEEIEGSSQSVLTQMQIALDEEFTISWGSAKTSTSLNGCTDTESQSQRGDGENIVLSESSSINGSMSLTPKEIQTAREVLIKTAWQNGYTGESQKPTGQGIERINIRTVNGGSVSAAVDDSSISVSVTTDCYLSKERKDQLNNN